MPSPSSPGPLLTGTLRGKSIEVPVGVPHVQHPIRDRCPTIEDRATTVGGGEKGISQGRIDRHEIRASAHHSHSWHRGDGTHHWTRGQASFPEECAIGRIERSQAPLAALLMNGRIASSHVKGAAVPGAGRDAALAALWTLPSDGYRRLPHWSLPELPKDKGIIDPILVRHAHQPLRAAADRGLEQRRGGSEIAIEHLLRGGHLPGADKRQV